jgi:SAM-dependent methyltransferase
MQYASSILQGSSPFELDFSPSEIPSPTIGIRRVLDIGCGTSATWCVGVLRETSGVEVTGLDVCPLLLDLRSLESSVSENFTFVKYDFLNDALPFASEVSRFESLLSQF